MDDLLLIYNFFKRNGNKLVLLTLIWLMFTLMFVQDAFGKHDENIRISNNGIISYYDFEGAKTGDQVIRDKVGKNDMRTFGNPEILNGEQGEGWYSNLVQILGADGFSYLEIPFTPNYNSKSFTIGFWGGFGSVGLDVNREFGPWDLHKNYYWSWGDKISLYITSELVEEEVVWWVEGDDDEVQTFQMEQYTVNLKFGDKTYIFPLHETEFLYTHYTVVYDGVNDVLVGYWEGQQQIRARNILRPAVGGNPIRFATDHKLVHNFSGRFDEIVFYNRPITPIEVAKLYSGMGLKVEPKLKLTTTWGEVKR